MTHRLHAFCLEAFLCHKVWRFWPQIPHTFPPIRFPQKEKASYNR